MFLKSASQARSNTLPLRYFHIQWCWVRYIVILRGSAAKRCIRIPMSDQSCTCNPHWHKRYRQCTTKWMHIGLHIIYKTAKDRRWSHIGHTNSDLISPVSTRFQNRLKRVKGEKFQPVCSRPQPATDNGTAPARKLASLTTRSNSPI